MQNEKGTFSWSTYENVPRLLVSSVLLIADAAALTSAVVSQIFHRLQSSHVRPFPPAAQIFNETFTTQSKFTPENSLFGADAAKSFDKSSFKYREDHLSGKGENKEREPHSKHGPDRLGEDRSSSCSSEVEDELTAKTRERKFKI